MIHSLQMIREETFSCLDCLHAIVERKFLDSLFQEKNFRNMKLQKCKEKIKLKYSSKKFGYPYYAEYEIIPKNDKQYEINYVNQFLSTQILLEKPSFQKLKVSIKVSSSLPIPEKLVATIIEKKLCLLKTK